MIRIKLLKEKGKIRNLIDKIYMIVAALLLVMMHGGLATSSPPFFERWNMPAWSYLITWIILIFLVIVSLNESFKGYISIGSLQINEDRIFIQIKSGTKKIYLTELTNFSIVKEKDVDIIKLETKGHKLLFKVLLTNDLEEEIRQKLNPNWSK